MFKKILLPNGVFVMGLFFAQFHVCFAMDEPTSPGIFEKDMPAGTKTWRDDKRPISQVVGAERVADLRKELAKLTEFATRYPHSRLEPFVENIMAKKLNTNVGILKRMVTDKSGASGEDISRDLKQLNDIEKAIDVLCAGISESGGLSGSPTEKKQAAFKEQILSEIQTTMRNFDLDHDKRMIPYFDNFSHEVEYGAKFLRLNLLNYYKDLLALHALSDLKESVEELDSAAFNFLDKLKPYTDKINMHPALNLVQESYERTYPWLV